MLRPFLQACGVDQPFLNLQIYGMQLLVRTGASNTGARFRYGMSSMSQVTVRERSLYAASSGSLGKRERHTLRVSHALVPGNCWVSVARLFPAHTRTFYIFSAAAVG